MKAQLLKVMQRNQLVDMIYIAKNGEISKRRIKVTKVSDDKFKAFCFTKHSSRTFIMENVLALVPAIRNGSEVV